MPITATSKNVARLLAMHYCVQASSFGDVFM